jgi:monoamine oxidase
VKNIRSRQKMTKDENTKTRREFLHSVGEAGGSAAVYQAMISMGLLMPGDAVGAELRNQWEARANQLNGGVKPTIAVLGGGISGLCVGYELKKAGFPFYVSSGKAWGAQSYHPFWINRR